MEIFSLSLSLCQFSMQLCTVCTAVAQAHTRQNSKHCTRASFRPRSDHNRGPPPFGECVYVHMPSKMQNEIYVCLSNVILSISCGSERALQLLTLPERAGKLSKPPHYLCHRTNGWLARRKAHFQSRPPTPRHICSRIYLHIALSNQRRLAHHKSTLNTAKICSSDIFAFVRRRLSSASGLFV